VGIQKKLENPTITSSEKHPAISMQAMQKLHFPKKKQMQGPEFSKYILFFLILSFHRF
jgi:hypothetical protein